jgi:PDZ domain
MKTNLVWLLMLALGATVPAAQAQDDDNKKEEKQQAHKARVVVVDKQDQDEDDDQEGKAGDHGVRSATQVRVEDGKLVVIDNEGNRQEFDISGAQGLTISSSTTEEEFDGVIDMEDMPQFQLRRGPLQARMRMIPDPAAPLGVLGGGEEGLANLDVVGGKYFIGVMCEAVDEETADELELEEASGLIVREVTEDSPAAKAGIESGDVLLLADDTELTEAAELVEVVQKAGEEGNHLTLTLLRDGNEEHIRVEPAERDMEQLGRMQFQMAPGMEGEGNFNLQFLPDMHALKAQLGDLQQLGPALMLEAQDLANNPELKAEIEEAMQEMRAEFEAAAAEMKEELQNAAEELRAQMEEFRAQIEGSREQLSRQKEELFP